MRRLGLIFIALLLAGILGGCCGTHTVTVQSETPEPTIVTLSDTVFVASPPDTLFLPGPERVVTRTVPVEVVRYRDARPDTARAYLLWHLAVDRARVEIAGAAGADVRVRRLPRCHLPRRLPRLAHLPGRAVHGVRPWLARREDAEMTDPLLSIAVALAVTALYDQGSPRDGTAEQ